MKNYSKGKSTIIGQIPENTEFRKTVDYVGEYPEKAMRILGYLKTHSDLFNKDQYNLFIEYKGEKFLLNVPSWYGKKLEADFVKSDQNPEEFFEDAFICVIETFKTKFNNDSYNIIIY